MKLRRFWMVFFAGILIAPLAGARPLLDEKVSRFLAKGSSPTEATLSVVLLYRQPAHLLLALDRAALEVALRKEAETQERRLRAHELRDLAAPLFTLWLVDGSLARVNRQQLQELSANPDLRAIFDGKRRISLNKMAAPAQTQVEKFTYGLGKLGVPALRESFPQMLGDGVRVGILDSGIDPSHPDLLGKVAAFRDFTPAQSPTPSDGFQHGTHVAGTIAGGAASGESIGVAPHAQLIIGKIFDGEGNSDTESILKAMQWMADPEGNPQSKNYPRAVNNSWSDSDPFTNRDPQDDPFCRAVDAWAKLGIIPVFSVGNTGPNDGTANIPGGCPAAFSVGATDPNDRSPWFSSGGPANWKSVHLVKPEIVAPGLDIISAKPGNEYQSMTGTSMSAPHITGSFALLFQAAPELSVEAAENALSQGAEHLGDPGKNNTFGWGRPDLLRTIKALQKQEP